MINTLLIICLIFIILDIPYLMTVNHRWNDMVENIQHSPIAADMTFAAVVYAFLAIGLYNFVLTRDLTIQETVMYSGLLGLTTYGVFNFTNMTIFKDYDLETALIDTAWGSVVTAGAGYIAKTYLM